MSQQKITELVLATTNQGKLAELRRMLQGHPVSVLGLDDFEPHAEAPEDGSTFAENARQKARYYAERLDRHVLADDSGLEVDALDGAPGVYSARFANIDSSDRDQRDQANNTKLLALLDGLPPEKCTARFRCCLCLWGPAGVLLEVAGAVEGIVTTEPCGKNGFGYDPLFYLPDLSKTAAELTPDQKDAISHRGQALQKLLTEIAPLLP